MAFAVEMRGEWGPDGRWEGEYECYAYPKQLEYHKALLRRFHLAAASADPYDAAEYRTLGRRELCAEFGRLEDRRPGATQQRGPDGVVIEQTYDYVRSLIDAFDGGLVDGRSVVEDLWSLWKYPQGGLWAGIAELPCFFTGKEPDAAEVLQLAELDESIWTLEAFLPENRHQFLDADDDLIVVDPRHLSPEQHTHDSRVPAGGARAPSASPTVHQQHDFGGGFVDAQEFGGGFDDLQDYGGEFEHAFAWNGSDDELTHDADARRAAQVEADAAFARQRQAEMDAEERAAGSTATSSTEVQSKTDGRALEQDEEFDRWVGTSAQGAARLAAAAAAVAAEPAAASTAEPAAASTAEKDREHEWEEVREKVQKREQERASGKKGKKRQRESKSDSPAHRRRAKKAAPIEDTALDGPPLPKVRVEQREVSDDGFHLSGAKRSCKKKAGRPRSRIVTRTRTSYTKGKALEKLHNPHDEERFKDLFPPDPEVKPSTSTTPVYTLDEFYVFDHRNPDKLVPLDRLLGCDRRTQPDVVIVGLAAPFDPEDGVHNDDTGHNPDDKQSAARTGNPGVDRRREVRLFARYDVRSLKFSVEGGPKLISKLAEYHLLAPGRAPGARVARKRGVAPRASTPVRDTVPYAPYAARLKRLLGVYALARSAAVRGDYVEGRDADISGHPEVVEVANEVRKLIETSTETSAADAQELLYPTWRLPLDELSLDDDPREELLMFRALPNPTFLPPVVYKPVLPRFPPGMTRTEAPHAAERDTEMEQHATKQLLERIRRMVTKRSAAKLEFRTLGDSILKESPEGVKDRKARCPVDVWMSAEISGVLYSKGDIVVIRGRLGEIWYAQIQYLHLDKDGDLAMHLRWFSTASNVPSLGPYHSMRELFLLDRCQSYLASELAGHVGSNNFKWLARGDLAPPTGFYCRFLYNTDDGSYTDRPDCTTWVHCDGYNLVRCWTCETAIAYRDSTIGESDDEDKDVEHDEDDEDVKQSAHDRRMAAVRSTDPDTLFMLGKEAYHTGDYVYVQFRDIDVLAQARNYTLPDGVSPKEALTPYRLACLVGIAADQAEADDDDEASIEDAVDKVVVRWLLREQELPQPADGTAFLSSTEVLLTEMTEDVPAINLQGHFRVEYLDVDAEADLLATLASMESVPHLFWARNRVSHASPDKPIVNDFGVFVGTGSTVVRAPLKKEHVPSCAHCSEVEKVEERPAKRLASLTERQREDFVVMAGALYSGGGLLDRGLENGCPVLRTRYAVEKHGPALNCMGANVDSLNGIKRAVSDFNEQVYFGACGEGTELPEPGRLLCLSGGSPCQGFSKLNRFKTPDDLRCLEPFVFLASLAIHRPLYAVYENVAAFETHALPCPIEGFEEGSFFRLFTSVAVSLGYQLRWSINNAAAFGVPQVRKRIIIQLAASGVPLPDHPPVTHAVKGARVYRDHSLLDERKSPAVCRKLAEDLANESAPHWPVSISEAIGDLPQFGVHECWVDVPDDEDVYEQRTFGPPYSSSNPAPYQTAARTSFQLAARTSTSRHSGEIRFADGVTHHVCRSVTKTVAERLRDIPLGGNHEGLVGRPHYPVPPPWVAGKPRKLEHWWARLAPESILAPLRTTLNLDGCSQGERIHYAQNRPLTFRELARSMGVDDSYELNFPSDLGDEAWDDALRLIGNGVPVPLGAAFGCAMHDALAPLLDAHLDAREPGGRHAAVRGNVWEGVWREIGAEALCVRSASASAARNARAASSASASGEESDVEPEVRHRVPLGAASSTPDPELGEDARRARDETGRTSLERSGGALTPATAWRVKVEIELEDSSEESGGEVGRLAPRGTGACEVIELSSDEDSSGED